MWTTLKPWQLGQLQRLAELDPERVETLLNSLWKTYPELLGDLALMATDRGELSVSQAAEIMGVSIEEIVARRQALRGSPPIVAAIVVDQGKSVARLVGQVPVWEVIREYRKLGGAERLREAFPGLSEVELASALRYAQEHPAEIEAQIEEYESLVTRRRGESFGYDRQAS